MSIGGFEPMLARKTKNYSQENFMNPDGDIKHRNKYNRLPAIKIENKIKQ